MPAPPNIPANETPYYFASLLERSARAGAAVVGGVVSEAVSVLLPLKLRQTRLYQVTVAQLLRIIVEMVGDVKGVYPKEEMPVEELFVRKTAGNVIELSSILAVGWSPVWLLAAASDLIGGTKEYLHALVAELKRVNALPADADISSFEELLTTLENTSGTLADTIAVLPLNVQDVRAAWQALQKHGAALPDARKLALIYADLQTAAQREKRSLLEMSSIVALGAVRTGLQMGHTYLFDYYRVALRTIADEGLLTYLRRVSTPYVERAIAHFDPQVPTFTERWLRERHKPRPGAEQPALPEEPAGGSIRE